MNPIDRQMLYEFIQSEIAGFYESKLDRLNRIRLRAVISKNPYLFRAKNLTRAEDLVESMLDALLSSSEEKMFGDLLERLAIFISEITSQGRKSSAQGIDLEFDDNGIRYLVAVKSGPNWGNSSQYQSLEANFRKAVTVQKQARSTLHVQPVLGICYGNTRTTDNGVYQKVTGQSFWHLISGEAHLYLEIMERIGFEASQHIDALLEQRQALQAQLVAEFTQAFCFPDGQIDWEKLLKFNSQNMAS